MMMMNQAQMAERYEGKKCCGCFPMLCGTIILFLCQLGSLGHYGALAKELGQFKDGKYVAKNLETGKNYSDMRDVVYNENDIFGLMSGEDVWYTHTSG